MSSNDMNATAPARATRDRVRVGRMIASRQSSSAAQNVATEDAQANAPESLSALIMSIRRSNRTTFMRCAIDWSAASASARATPTRSVRRSRAAVEGSSAAGGPVPTRSRAISPGCRCRSRVRIAGDATTGDQGRPTQPPSPHSTPLTGDPQRRAC
jgi:hypothetical protein